MQYFTNFLAKNSLLSNTVWPDKSYLDDYAWEQINRLYRWTSEDLHEYEVSLFDIDSDVIFSPIDRGNTERVVSSHNAEVKYIPDDKTKTYLKEMYSDKVLVRKKMMKYEALPKDIKIKYLCNFHTHPKYRANEIEQLRLTGKQDLYSFFSSTDVNSLIKSNSFCIGLITDRVWILCKTIDSPDILSSDQEMRLHKITTDKLTNPAVPVIDLAKDILEELHLKLYTARFNEPLDLLN